MENFEVSHIDLDYFKVIGAKILDKHRLNSEISVGENIALIVSKLGKSFGKGYEIQLKLNSRIFENKENIPSNSTKFDRLFTIHFYLDKNEVIRYHVLG